MKPIFRKILFALVIFVVSIAGPSYSFLKKGYTPGADYLNLTEARNVALTQTYATESGIGVFLSSSRAAQEGISVGIPNPLTPIIYGYIFRWFGFHTDLPFWISIMLFGIFNVLLFFLIDRLAGSLAAFWGSLISALMPSMTLGALFGGYYEWAMVFFVLALWLYLGSKKGPWGAGVIRVFGAGVLFALAALARNAFAISFLPFFFYDAWHHRSWKRSAAILIPFLLLFGTTLTSFSWLGVPNGYTAGSDEQPWAQVGHFFNDPYQYHFNKDVYIKDLFSNPKALDKNAFSYAIHYGYPITFAQRMSIYRDSFLFYIPDLFNFTSTGGFLIWLMMAVGAVWLWRHQRLLLMFFGTWFVIWLAALMYSRTANWDHTMEIVFMFALLGGIGCKSLFEWLTQQGWTKNIALASVTLLLFGHLGAANQWRLFDAYRSSRSSEGESIINALTAMPLDKSSVTAIGTRSEVAAQIAYETDRSVIFFHPDTVEDLAKNGKLPGVFRVYGVTGAAGYSDELSGFIQQQTQASILSQN